MSAPISKVMFYFAGGYLVYLSTFQSSMSGNDYEHQQVAADYPEEWYYGNSEDISFRKSKWERNQREGTVLILNSLEEALDYASVHGHHLATKRLLELI